MFLQAICTDDRAYEVEKSTRSFTNQLIFPGGCLPSVERIGRSLSGRPTCAASGSRTSRRAMR